MENDVGAGARNVGVRWDRARGLVWVREWRRERVLSYPKITARIPKYPTVASAVGRHF
jgi:hypothetical protein